LIGYILILNDNVIRYLAFSQIAFGSGGNTVNRLIMTYIALVLIASASAIFYAFCPTEIKRYASEEDFVIASEPIRNEIHDDHLDMSLRSGDATARQQLYDIQRNEDLYRNHDAAERHFGPDFEIKSFRSKVIFYYRMTDRSRKWVRFATGTLYVIGFGILFCQSAIVFLRIVVGMGRFPQPLPITY
jgi:hypothetical protein